MSEQAPDPIILERAEHQISRNNIDSDTLKVLYRLHRSGYKAFLVGGAVRDMMLGIQPKDFDVATAAKPNEVRRLFRNCRIIGRRFRLAHIYFEGHVIEVATFRRTPDPHEQATGPDDLLITSDNTWGSPREDAFRRDFTINALFYNIADFSVIDYCGGIQDLEDGIVRVIGDPDVRFQEDPVRMLRACEFAARLSFRIEAETAESIERCRGHLAKASPARLTDELLQLLRCGHTAKAFQFMLDLDLLDVLLPETYDMVKAAERRIGSFHRLPSVLDQWAAEGREIPEPVIFASLLVASVLLRRYEQEAADGRPMSRSALDQLAAEVVEPFGLRLTLSAARRQQAEETLIGFLRLCEPVPSEAIRKKVARRHGFHDALQLFELMVEATGEGQETLDAWQSIAPPLRPRRNPKSVRPRRPKRRPRRRGRRRS